MVRLIIGKSKKETVMAMAKDKDSSFVIDEDPITIDSVKNLRKSLSVRGKKIAIIWEAQRLTREAGNALLKILEEPHREEDIILTASSELALLPTIVSRCEVIRLKARIQSANKPEGLGYDNIDDWITYTRSRLLKNEDIKYLEELKNILKAKDSLGQKGVNKKLVLENLALKLFNKINYERGNQQAR